MDMTTCQAVMTKKRDVKWRESLDWNFGGDCLSLKHRHALSEKKAAGLHQTGNAPVGCQPRIAGGVVVNDGDFRARTISGAAECL